MNAHTKQALRCWMPHALFCICVLFTLPACAQYLCPKDEYGLGRKATSPLSNSLTDLSIEYCTALIRRGQELDDVMPYDKVWLTDTLAPIFTTKSPIRLGDLRVPAGSYSLHFLRSRSVWKLIVNEETGQPAANYDETRNLGRAGMIAGPAPGSPVENLTLLFEPTSGKGVLWPL